ncbi:MAG: hypothetical protein KAI55_00370 [Candidatus Aenigmarchaeota archaeon]|nr:hypothetical protein [Candidatus Aenigmarchaeota archaeon]
MQTQTQNLNQNSGSEQTQNKNQSNKKELSSIMNFKTILIFTLLTAIIIGRE